MRLRYFVVILCFLSLASCAQTKSIKKSYAFTTVRIPGNIPVGPDKKPLIKVPDTITVVYLEIKKDAAPSWKYAWKNDQSYSINAQKVSGNSIEVGKKKTDGEEVSLTAAKGNELWVLTFAPLEEKKASPQRLKRGEILLQGMSGNKKVYQKITSSVELTTAELL